MKITKTVYLHVQRQYDGKYEYHVLASEDMSEFGYVQVAKQEVTFELPDDFSAVPQEIEALRKAKAKLQADVQVKINAIDDQIGKLSSLEYKPESE